MVATESQKNTNINRMPTNEYLYKPAFYAHILSSIAMIVALMLFVFNYKKIMKMDVVEIIKIMALIAISVASHGQGHTTLEKEYGYDPVSALFK